MTRAVLFLLAIVLAVIPAGNASAQLDTPEGLFFAEIPEEVKMLVEQLYVAPTPAAQADAAGKLGAMGEGAGPAVSYLIGILSEKIDPTVRQAVIETLGKVGKPALDQVLTELKAERPEMRTSMIDVLERMADKQAAGPLTETMLRDPSQTVRDRALNALARLATLDPTVGQKLLTTVQNDQAKPEIRSRAIKALGRMAGAGVPIDALVTMLEDAEADIRLRCAAAAALGQSRNTEAVSPLIKALGDEMAPVRLWAAIGLNGISASEAVSALIKALEDEDDRVRVRAADALAAVQDPKVIDPLTKAASDTNAEVRTWAVIGLGNYSDKKAVEALGAAIRDSDVQVRVSAADSLGRMQNPQATPLLIARLNDFSEESEVRSAAARALGGLRDSRAVPTLLGLIRDNDASMRRWVVSALGRIGDARAIEPLIGALSDSEASVRGWAALALARFRDPRIIEPLVEATKDPDAEVRGRAVLALRVGIKNPAVRAAVEDAASDPDPSVQKKAKQVLGAN